MSGTDKSGGWQGPARGGDGQRRRSAGQWPVAGRRWRRAVQGAQRPFGRERRACLV